VSQSVSGPTPESLAIPRPRGRMLPLSRAFLCTLGPSSLNERVIRALDEIGVSSFRINMSHTELSDLGGIMDLIQNLTEVPICIDTEGAQMRTGVMDPGTSVVEGTRVRLSSAPEPGDETTIPLTPGYVVDQLRTGAWMSIDFDSVLLRIDRVEGGSAFAKVITGGDVGTRKAVTALPSPKLSTFSEKDLPAIQLAARRGIHQFALSFCDHADSVRRLRALVGRDATIIAKIESREGVRNLTEIARVADRLLIDRGDLSRAVRLEAIPLLQKAIVRRANTLGIPVYVATNLLESMVTRRTPTRAEVNDVINTLLDGANGLVLAAETAIGKFPVEAARMIATLLKEYDGSIEGYHLEDLLGEHPLSVHPATRPDTRASTAGPNAH
jgi:pyruvate kinase